MFSSFDNSVSRTDEASTRRPFCLCGTVAFSFYHHLPLSIGSPLGQPDSAFKGQLSLIGLVVSNQIEEPGPEQLHGGRRGRTHSPRGARRERLSGVIIQGLERFKVEKAGPKLNLVAKVSYGPDVVEKIRPPKIEALKQHPGTLPRHCRAHAPGLTRSAGSSIRLTTRAPSFTPLPLTCAWRWEDRLALLLEDTLREDMAHLVRYDDPELEGAEIGQQIRSGNAGRTG